MTYRRRGPRLAALACLGALAVAGCGSGSDHRAASAPAHTVSNRVLERAAASSAASPGERVAVQFAARLPVVGPLSASGTGGFDNAPASGRLSLHAQLSDPAALGAAGSALSHLDLALVLAGAKLYAQLPSSVLALTGSLTGNRPWLSVDLARLAGSASAGADHSARTSGGPTGLLRRVLAAAGPLTPTGHRQVDGVPTSTYRGGLDTGQLTGSLTAAQRRQLKREGGSLTSAKVPFTAAIDAQGRLRRVTLDLTGVSLGPVNGAGTLRIDILAYGHQPVPSAPPAAQTAPLTGRLLGLGAS